MAAGPRDERSGGATGGPHPVGPAHVSTTDSTTDTAHAGTAGSPGRRPEAGHHAARADQAGFRGTISQQADP